MEEFRFTAHKFINTSRKVRITIHMEDVANLPFADIWDMAEERASSRAAALLNCSEDDVEVVEG